MNGSTMDSSGNCVCLKGFTGEMCEKTICAPGQTQNCVDHPLKAKAMYLSINECNGNNNVKVNLNNNQNASGMIFNLCPEPTTKLSVGVTGTPLNMVMNSLSCNYLNGKGPGMGGSTWTTCAMYLADTRAKDDYDLVFIADPKMCMPGDGYGPVGLIDPVDCKMLGGLYNGINSEGKSDCHLHFCRADGLRSAVL